MLHACSSSETRVVVANFSKFMGPLRLRALGARAFLLRLAEQAFPDLRGLREGLLRLRVRDRRADLPREREHVLGGPHDEFPRASLGDLTLERVPRGPAARTHLRQVVRICDVAAHVTLDLVVLLE